MLPFLEYLLVLVLYFLVFRQAVHSVVGLVGLRVFSRTIFTMRDCSVFSVFSFCSIAYTFICFAYLRKIFLLAFCFKEMGGGACNFYSRVCVYLLACFAIGFPFFFLYIAQWLLSSRCLLVLRPLLLSFALFLYTRV